eukprot:jgi/Ulvmu1/92/UM001_0095.1
MLLQLCAHSVEVTFWPSPTTLHNLQSTPGGMESQATRQAAFTDIFTDARWSDPMFLAQGASVAQRPPQSRTPAAEESLTTTIPVDMIETNEHVEILANLPGIPKDRIQVSVERMSLTISVSAAPKDSVGIQYCADNCGAAASNSLSDVAPSSWDSPRRAKQARTACTGLMGSSGTDSEGSTRGGDVPTRGGAAVVQPTRNIIYNERSSAHQISRRVLQLPDQTDSSTSQAAFTDGVLRIVMRKVAPTPRFLNIA